jgi:diguanylate cyclase (GGDEF)-like protein
MKLRFSLGNLSLRAKLILCFLLVTLTSSAVIGGLAYGRLMQKFDDLVMQEAGRRFSSDVSDYFRAYGSWAEGQRREGFRSFTERRNELLGRPLGAQIGPGIKPTLPEQAPALPNLTPDSLMLNPVPEGNPPPPPPGNMHRPPFRFYLFDTNFHSLMKLPPYGLGDPVRASDRDRLLPIESDGRIVAHFLPEGKVNYSDLDLGYLAAMREALLFGIVAGMVLTLVLGFLLSDHFVRRLRRLTRAVKAMSKGDLKQQVEIESRDEVGVLARAFNRMSADLSRQYTELEESKKNIEKMADQMRELSMRDALTHLHNRRYFDEHCAKLFQHAVRYQRPFSVMIADIDHFKQINDTFSHATGDEVLRRLGEILQNKTRSSDLVARYGGEEFVIAFPETELRQAHETCEALRKRIESYPWHEVHPDLKVTISMGLSSDPKVQDFHAMVNVADDLLYRAKNNGRNQVCSAGDMAEADA